jgi:hypothetical protein
MRLCEGCERGNHFMCVGHYCECDATECVAIMNGHVVCPPCKEGKHIDCLGHNCHCQHFRWRVFTCAECQAYGDQKT